MTSNYFLNRSLRRLAPLVLSLAAVACGGMRRSGNVAPTFIYFTNESLDQATVYMIVPGADFRRIGTVFPGRTDTLRVPTDLAMRGGTVNIVARMLARSELPTTGPVTLRPGGEYQVRLPMDARLLSFLPTGQ